MAWQHIDDLPIDRAICELVKSQGITELYPPQHKSVPYVLKGENVVLSVPTASGKSLVAYLAILEAALRGKKSLYIVPLRALASEKWNDLQPFRELGIKIGISTGDLSQASSHLSRNDIIICTSEKADSLLRHGAGWESEVEIIVADEIHLINDYSRGPTLEMVLTRMRVMNPELQVIALSATIKNADVIASWLDARLIESEWRPVPLREGIFYQDTIYFLDGTEKTIEGTGKTERLVTDTISEGGQVLVFVNSRQSAQRLAQKLGDLVKQYIAGDRKVLKKAAASISSSENAIAITSKLVDSMQNGVAFHHAGLLHSHRSLVEKLFRQRALKCIVATPTLAAGVNTPARRVIMKHLYRYSGEAGCMIPIPLIEVKQAMGRAGRPGYDEEGEAILLAKNKSEKERLITAYLQGDVEPIYSKLGSEPALRIHLLALIATSFAITLDEILEFLSHTFYSFQAGWIPERTVEDILFFLEEHGFIVKKDVWKATPFGQKATSLYLDPLSAIKMRDALEAGTGTPFGYLHAICATPDMNSLYLTKQDEWVEEILKNKRLLLQSPSPWSPNYEWFLAEVKTAALLYDWIEEKQEDILLQHFNVGPGDVRSKVEIAKWLLHAMRELARQYNFDAVTPLTNLIVRVEHGCHEELLGLVKLQGIGRVRARSLYTAGFKNINNLRAASIRRLAAIPYIGEKIARSIKDQVE